MKWERQKQLHKRIKKIRFPNEVNAKMVLRPAERARNAHIAMLRHLVLTSAEHDTRTNGT
jgi:hypothetical protein